jgi:UMF1 family MFS transporter
MSRRAGFLAWACYDLANTFFAVAMISFHFPLWVVEDRGAKEVVFSLAVGASMLIVAVLMPVCGTLSDVTHQRARYLRWTTLLCVAATCAIGLVDRLGVALALFVLANVAYHLGTVFYDALLAQVAEPERLGHASGIGAAFGYLGSMLGQCLLYPFAQAWGHQGTFIPSALFFLAFALPSFFLVRDPPSAGPSSPAMVVHLTWTQLHATWRLLRSIPGILRLLVASFFSLNAINTILVFMVVYTKKVLGFSEGEVIRFFLWGQLFAVAGSLLSARVIHAIGARRALQLIWTGWGVALGLVCLKKEAWWLWSIAPAIGLCLGATWSTSRVLLLELSPPEHLAQCLGVSGLLGRASSIIGPIVWGLIVLDPTRYRHALVALIGLLVVGLWIFRRVPDPRALRLAPHPT